MLIQIEIETDTIPKQEIYFRATSYRDKEVFNKRSDSIRICPMVLFFGQNNTEQVDMLRFIESASKFVCGNLDSFINGKLGIKVATKTTKYYYRMYSTEDGVTYEELNTWYHRRMNRIFERKYDIPVNSSGLIDESTLYITRFVRYIRNHLQFKYFNGIDAVINSIYDFGFMEDISTGIIEDTFRIFQNDVCFISGLGESCSPKKTLEFLSRLREVALKYNIQFIIQSNNLICLNCGIFRMDEIYITDESKFNNPVLVSYCEFKNCQKNKHKIREQYLSGALAALSPPEELEYKLEHKYIYGRKGIGTVFRN